MRDADGRGFFLPDRASRALQRSRAAMACCAAMSLRTLALIALLAAACGGGRGRSDATARTPPEQPFARIHRWIEQFDLARFAGEDAALAALSDELAGGTVIRRGAPGTERAIELLLVKVDELLAADRLHPGAVAARTLLGFDGWRPPGRAEVWRRMMELKAIARSDSPLAASARLRLGGYCLVALRDAAAAPYRHRVKLASHCLYPAYDSDPEPYFDPDPERRPPTPDWQRVLDDLEEVLAPGRAWGRLEPARAALVAQLNQAGAPGAIPVEPLVGALPTVAEAILFDWSPRLELPDRGGATDLAPARLDALKGQVHADGRGLAHLWIDAGQPKAGAAIRRAAQTSSRAGVAELELLVATGQQITVPPGDHWSGRLPNGSASRAGRVALSLAPMSGAGQDPRSPRLLDWTIGLRLHLVIGATRWRLLAPTGVIASAAITPDTHAAGQLVQALERVRAAFPDEQNLVLVLEPEASYPAAAVLAASAARRGGAPLFRLGLAERAPPVRERGLARRVERRAAAELDVTPASLASASGPVLSCYRDLLERAPALAGKVRLEFTGGQVRAVGGTDRRLVRCATSGLDRAMREAGAASAEVSFQVAPR
jgi:hypothetical protein